MWRRRFISIGWHKHIISVFARHRLVGLPPKLDLKRKRKKNPKATARCLMAQHYWLVTAWDQRLSSRKSCQLTICCSTVFSVSRYLWLMPVALIIEQQIPLQFVALGASNSHFNYSPGQSMTELGRGEKIQWGRLTKGKKIDQITRHGYWRHESERTGRQWNASISLQPHEWQWMEGKLGAI